MYDEYNEQAAILGKIVKRIFQKRETIKVRDPLTVAEAVEEPGALQSIPKLVMDGIYRKDSVSGHRDHDELYFWQLEHWQYKHDAF